MGFFCMTQKVLKVCKQWRFGKMGSVANIVVDIWTVTNVTYNYWKLLITRVYTCCGPKNFATFLWQCCRLDHFWKNAWSLFGKIQLEKKWQTKLLMVSQIIWFDCTYRYCQHLDHFQLYLQAFLMQQYSIHGRMVDL